MKTIVAKVDLRQASSAEVIQTAAKILQEGGLVAFPTETVYGLGGNGLDSAACEKIYLAKGRPSDNPLILHISEIEELDRIVAEVSPQAKALMDAFWPGPLTMIFKKKDIVPAKATGGLLQGRLSARQVCPLRHRAPIPQASQVPPEPPMWSMI